jgi:hypothetical protein
MTVFAAVPTEVLPAQGATRGGALDLARTGGRVPRPKEDIRSGHCPTSRADPEKMPMSRNFGQDAATTPPREAERPPTTAEEAHCVHQIIQGRCN